MIRTSLIWSAAAIAAMVAIAWFAGERLPAEGRIPVHWNAAGEPDRFASADEARRLLWLLPGAATAIAALLAVAPLLDPLRANVFRSGVAYSTIWRATMVVTALAQGLVGWSMVTAAEGGGGSLTVRLVALVVSALLVVKGNVLPKTRPSFILGIRTPWTLSSDVAWEKTHRLAGRLFVLSGLTGMAAALIAPERYALYAPVGLAIASFVASAAYSYVAWRAASDKRRTADFVA